MKRLPDRYDLVWTPRQTAALIALCLIAGAAGAAHVMSPQLSVGDRLPVWPDRLADSRLRINPNTAPAARLECLPGIGPAKAGAIVIYRDSPATPPFAAADDLAAVHGIGEGLVRKMTPYLRFD